MFRRCTVALVAAWPFSLAWAQQPAPAGQPVAVPGQSVPATGKLTNADLEELLAPIALYPDPLLANVLAASVYPDEVAKAAKYVKDKGDPNKIDSFDWEPSVKAIALVPDAIKMMGEFADWTAALGQAYLLQSQDVMKAVQSLRARAQANGALKSTPQQVVTTQSEVIVIQPAQPDIIYVPSYNPSVVYVEHHDSSDVVAAGIIGFGTGLAVGAILANNNDCDWNGGCVSNGGNNININNNFDRETNIGNNNNRGGRPGQEGGAWRPNDKKAQRGRTDAADRYRGAGRGGSNARVPGRQPGSAPIADRPAPRPSTQPAGNRPAGNRPGSPAAQPPARPPATSANRPANPSGSRPAAPANRPAVPPSRPPAASQRPATPQSRPSTPQSRPAAPSSRPSAFSGGGGAAASRGAASRGGGGRGGGGRGGGGRR